jgi:hypothetical protein
MSLDEETSQLHRNLLRRRGKLRRVAVVGALLGIAVGVVGAAAAREWDPGPATPSTNASDATAGTPDQISADRDASGPGLSADAAIAQVLASLGDSSVISATVMQPPVAGSSNPVGSAPWLDIHIDSDQGDGTKQVWLGQLVQGAVADLMRTTQTTTSEVLDGAQIVDRDGSGHQIVTGLGHGSVLGGQVFDSPDDAALRHHARDIAAKFGLKVESVQVLHPLESALAITFTVPDGRVDWTIGELKQAIEGSPPRIEGLYLQLDSPSGKPLLRGGGASRIPGGALWFAVGQDERFGALHG